MISRRMQWCFGLAALVVVLLAGAAASDALTGAIYTSTASGALVNGNIYDAKTDVYLNGGPPPNAPCTSGGLPDGDYYFQVTDPSGSVLLSTDAISERAVRVIGGFIAVYLGTTHLIGTGKCPGAITVALFPYDDTPNPGGEYKVWITRIEDYNPPYGSYGFVPGNIKTDNFKVRHTSISEVAITGAKFYDANTNGLWDPDEPPIPGWRIEKVPPTPADVTYTSTGGQYSFLVPRDSGQYTISEVPPPPGWFPLGSWINTTPTSGIVTVAAVDVAGPVFGNVCLGPGGGRTLGFWSNKNGQSVIGGMPGGTSGTLAFLSGLNLRNGSGADFDPTSYAGFRTWLLSATATNMAYMLSAQLAAMELNVRAGFVSESALVFAPGTQSANSAGFATVGDLIAEANAELGTHGLALAGDAWRSYQEALKNALDAANNNQTFVQPGPCPFITPY